MLRNSLNMKNRIFLKLIKENTLCLLKVWDQFWFAPKGTFTTSLFRCFISLFIFIFYFSRILEFDFYFGESGILPYITSQDIIPYFYKTPFPIYPFNENLLFSYHILFLLFLLLMIIGVGGRTIALFTFCLHMIFFHRNYMIVYGADFMSGIALFICIFLKTDNYFTVLSLLKRKKLFSIRKKDLKGDLLHSVGCRLLQFQVISIYGYSAMEKIRGVTWWEGSAIWKTLANGQLATIDFSFLAHIPLLVVILTFVTILWELYFPILVWLPSIKYWVLGFGFIFHLTIGLMINIPYFSILMVLFYLIYLDYDRDLREWIEKKLKSS